MPSVQLCPLCQQANNCELLSAENTNNTCWCMRVNIAPEVLAKVPLDQVNIACICKACARPIELDCKN